MWWGVVINIIAMVLVSVTNFLEPEDAQPSATNNPMLGAFFIILSCVVQASGRGWEERGGWTGGERGNERKSFNFTATTISAQLGVRYLRPSSSIHTAERCTWWLNTRLNPPPGAPSVPLPPVVTITLYFLTTPTCLSACALSFLRILVYLPCFFCPKSCSISAFFCFQKLFCGPFLSKAFKFCNVLPKIVFLLLLLSFLSPKIRCLTGKPVHL